jgi:2-polyprenyl-6-methoxyphenol hydroxylase-like FAD-dependent oxidoreductase
VDITSLRTTIVGAGIGGMTAALLLARAGAAVLLLERAAEIRAVGAGILLQPNGLAVLSGLRLDGALRGTGHAMTATAVRGPDGAAISTVRVPDFGPGLDHVLAVRRSNLHEVLLTAVRQAPAIQVRLGARVAGASGAGTVTLHGGSSTTADLVIGADGISSAVRASGEFGARTRNKRHSYVRGLVSRSGPGLEGEFWSPLGLFGGSPVDRTTQYFYASAAARTVRAAIAARDLSALRRAWAGALPHSAPVLDSVERFEDLLINEVQRVDCARWHDGARVLLGDAAHAMSPTAGQGANSALVDALVLVAELASADSLPEGVAAYTARRRPAVRRVQDQADRLALLAHLHGRPARRLRDGLLRSLEGREQVAERIVHVAQQEDPPTLRTLADSLQRRT